MKKRDNLLTIFLLYSLLFTSCSTSKTEDTRGYEAGDYDVTQISRGLHGYISFNSTKPTIEYGAGISFYSAVWPLIDKPLANFQIGLPSTWISPENSEVDFPLCPEGTHARDNWAERGPTWASVFQTIEGGLGYWAGNRFRYGPPKFSMNATSSCYDFEIASPGWNFFRESDPLDDDKMGIAQLSNRLLVPPDGLTFEGNPNGDFLGYSWMALPFMDPKEGPPPTGDQSWTLFLNALNFKGPIAYYIPETWSKISKDYTPDYGRGLDARPGVMGGGAMEINTVPRIVAKNEGDTVYYKIPKLYFPLDDYGRSLLVQNVKYYSKDALFNDFYEWRKGGDFCDGQFKQQGVWEPEMSTRMPRFNQDGVELENVDQYFTTSIIYGDVFGLRWKNEKGTPGIFPQYYRQIGDGKRITVTEDQVPAVLVKKEFLLAGPRNPYTSPDAGSWASPGPVSEPFEVTLLDGSTVVYRWYRFVDQPSFQQFDWSDEDKEELQSLVEKIHATWKIDHKYMEDPHLGELIKLDPALLVEPPEGYETGYVPIVTAQRFITL